MPTIHIDELSTVLTMDFARDKGVWPRRQMAQVVPAVGGASLPPREGGGGVEIVAPPPSGGVFAEPQPATTPEAKTFQAEGVLKEALRQVFEKARSAKIEAITKLTVKLFEYADAFKLVPVAASVQGAKRTVLLEGSYQTKEGSVLEFNFTGNPNDATVIKGYLEPQFRAAEETDMKASLVFAFDAGLSLTADATEKFVEKLTRFASAAAHVEAIAEVK
jgi:hypothetical protein